MNYNRKIAANAAQRRYRAKGRQIAVVITDPAAMRALDLGCRQMGGVKAAIEYALVWCWR